MLSCARIFLPATALPDGRPAEIAAALSGGEVAHGNNIDPEGGLTGGALNGKRALLNVGVAYVTGKVLDDVLEEGLKAALGATVAGSAETAARYTGLAAGTFVFLMHRGREVGLDRHTELEFTLTRDARIEPAGRH